MILHGDCLEVLKTLESESIDATVTDPPYHLGPAGFMQSAWDRGGIAFNVELWQEVLRVLKPGGHLVSFGGTRTYHRMACAVEDAGFEIRDSLLWLYGQGFPKSLNLSKAIDKADGLKDSREVVHRYTAGGNAGTSTKDKGGTYVVGADNSPAIELAVTRGATEKSRAWDGYGTALKPGHEPIVLARKPLSEKTVAKNAVKHGTGALNIDACRVATDWNEPDRPESWKRSGHTDKPDAEKIAAPAGNGIECHPGGRFPPNVLLTHSAECSRKGLKTVRSHNFQGHSKGRKNSILGKDNRARPPGGYAENGAETVGDWRCVEGCPVRELDGQSGELKSGEWAGNMKPGASPTGHLSGKRSQPYFRPADTGTASRFFPQLNWHPTLDDLTPFLYCAKASRRERETGLADSGIAEVKGRRNVHPTVKPVELMRWLVRLVCRPGGTVLDLFTGSGTTGVACALEGMEFTGIEKDAQYVAIANARIDHYLKTEQLDLFKRAS